MSDLLGIGSVASQAIDSTNQNIQMAVNNWTQAESNSRQRQFQKDQAEYAYRMDLEQWNRANRYNSPAEQMKRFQDAGLNPNLVYGRGESGNATSAPPRYQAVNGQFGGLEFTMPMIGNMIGAYQDAVLKNKQTDLLSMEIDAVNKSNLLKELDALIKQMDIDKRAGKTPGAYAYKGTDFYDIQAKELGNRLNEAKIREVMSRGDNLQAVNWWLNNKNQSYQQTGINPDKDEYWMRLISSKYGEKISKFLDAIGKYF